VNLGILSTLSSAYGQLQSQRARSFADQAGRRADGLRVEADRARVAADQADRQAVSLNAEAREARGTADLARGAVTTIQGWDALGEKQAAQRVQIARAAFQPAVTASPSASSSPIVAYAAPARVGAVLDLSA